jgi:F-type H+-transporting ATPase subunit gamma
MRHLRDVRRQIKTVGGISHLTDAMQKISSVRLSKAKSRLANSKTYSDTINQVLSRLLRSKNDLVSSLFKKNKGDSVLIFLLSSDRGLLGAYNENIFSKVLAHLKITGKNVKFLILGKKGLRYFQNRNYEVVKYIADAPVFFDYNFCETIGDYILSEYLQGKYSSVYFAYTSFISMAKHEPRIKKILPLEFEIKEIDNAGDTALFEPKKEDIIGYFLPEYLKSVIWDGMLQSSSSEHASRTFAMEKASKNARDLVGNLQLSANKLRQAGITSELTDIIGSMEGMV